MNSTKISLIALLASFLANLTPAYADSNRSRPRLIVIPFDNLAGKPSQQYLALGLAALVAEKLEEEESFETVNGPLILTEDQVRLIPANGTPWDQSRVARFAAEQGASYVLAGSYAGDVEHWTVNVVLYLASGGNLIPLSAGSRSGTQIETFRGRAGQKLARVSLANIQSMLAGATLDALRNGNIPPSRATVSSFTELPTEDAYAYILYSRALGKLFLDAPKRNVSADLSGSDATALGSAEHAVRVDPKFQEARRLYAALLAAIGTPKSRDRARLHYEEALKVKPDDLRSLVALGHLDTECGDFDDARTLLKRATELKQTDPEPHFWYGKALLGLEDRAAAQLQFERARELSGNHLEARRELVLLYSTDRRYLDAAKELEAITAQAPQDVDAAFRLAACYRAARRLQDAAAAYSRGAERFGKKEARFLKFQGDMLAELGEDETAGKIYRSAAALAPKDARLSVLLNRRTPGQNQAASPPIGGKLLLGTIEHGTRLSDLIEPHRSGFQDSANDAVLLAQQGKDGCPAAAASAKLAKFFLVAYSGKASDMHEDALALKTAKAAGEDAALTPDEARAADAVITHGTRSELDWREMTSLYWRSVRPALTRARCPDQPEAPMASLPDVEARNQNRKIDLPVVKPPRWRPPASPDVPSDPARIVTFAVSNRSKRAYALTLDGDAAHLTPLPPQERRTFTARIGFHRLCLQPAGLPCDTQSDLLVSLHEGWEIVIQPGKQ